VTADREKEYSMDRSMMTTRRVLAEFLSELALTEVGVRLWDGTRWPDENPRPTTLVLNHPGALRRMFLSRNDVGLAEAYLYDDFDIQGDIEPVFRLAEGLARSAEGLGKKLRLARNLLRLPKNNGRPAAR
jgi:cyclopropane-fatty-acyl-phospholipid synthase